jgi:hypothetical protein
MQFESRLKRIKGLTIALGAGLEILIAIILAEAFDGGFLGFLAAFAGLQILYFALWAKHSIQSWLVYFVMRRKVLANALHDELVARGFPEPAEHHRSVGDFLGDVAMDETQPITARLAAAGTLGTLSGLASQHRVQESLQLSMACEDALMAFKRSILQSARRDETRTARR